ncbi:MAG: hypothetical protein WDO56_31655 [Gammaproteobacteria bacterium]
MTAEIAIINKGAVTLATDSAVTLTVRGSQKIYNCADKLFELSDHDPMGIMVFNNLSFMGVPLDVAIKQFRGGKGSIRYDTITEAATAFFRYLEEDLLPSTELQKQHARGILSTLLESVLRTFQKASTTEWEKHKKTPDYDTIFSRTAKNAVANLEALDTAECFVGVTEADATAFFADVIEDVVKSVFKGLPLGAEHIALVSRACVLALLRNKFSDLLTGIVFAGFGKGETFPSLLAYEIDGVILNKLKRRETHRVIAGREQIAGEIIPFAQREMVDRFLYGIDPEFEGGIEEYLKIAIGAAGTALGAALPKMKKATKVKVDKSLHAATQTAIEIWQQKMLPAVKERFMREVQDMVYLMPKPELARLATELINLTSVKRKFSSGKDTVGGPIDVAVISKTDGFVWVRRKHYFKPELNPRYFDRKFGKRNIGDAK